MTKGRLILVLETVFFAAIFFLSIIPPVDPDIWFHLKSGEVILQKGLIHYDVFSHSAAGREWFPYEWLFQVGTYLFKTMLGFDALRFLLAGTITGMVLVMHRILRRIFGLHPILSMIACFYFFVSVFEFFSIRPHVFAYTFLLINLYLILLYCQKGKNRLWLTIPVTLVWANMHGSVFLDAALFGAYAAMAVLARAFPANGAASVKNRAKTLGFYTIVTAVLTVLPPLGILQYRLLWIFWQNRDFLSKFIDEWTPLDANPFIFIYLSLTIFLILGIFIIVEVKKRSLKNNLWVIPLLPFLVMAYTASRNVFLAYISITLILGYLLSQINLGRMVGSRRYVIISVIIFFIIGSHIFILSEKRQPQRWYYPAAAAQFIKSQNLSGNMFNDYGYGGYLLYHLYPAQKVFYDGRTDVYLCCEMRDTMGLAVKKTLPDADFKKVTDGLWVKYDISYVLIRTQKHSVLRKMARILTDDPDWSLVFWDDNSQLFVRHDGKNKDILAKYGANSATPYNQDPYRKDRQKEALAEYSRMMGVADSAKSRNAVGYIYLEQGRFTQAKREFEKANILDPSFESPYMNLAELAAADKNYYQAIILYQKALKLAPDRGLIYIRLGELYMAGYNDTGNARKVWQEGLKNVVDGDAKEKLRNLLARLT